MYQYHWEATYNCSNVKALLRHMVSSQSGPESKLKKLHFKSPGISRWEPTKTGLKIPLPEFPGVSGLASLGKTWGSRFFSLTVGLKTCHTSLPPEPNAYLRRILAFFPRVFKSLCSLTEAGVMDPFYWSTAQKLLAQSTHILLGVHPKTLIRNDESCPHTQNRWVYRPGWEQQKL